MVKEPRNRPSICFIIKGRQGVGKNVLLNAISNVIGKEHFITSSKPSDFFGEHAEGFYRKLLVNLNEAEGKDTFDFEGKLKSFISEDTLTVNPKNIRPTQVNNVARTIITTNKENPIPIDVRSSDRRYVVFKSTNKYLKYKDGFWGQLVKHFNSPIFIASLYDYLMELDYKGLNWVKDRPITNDYKEMIKAYIPIEAMFLEEFLNKNGCENTLYEIKTSTFRDNFNTYCSTNDFLNEKKMNPKRFTMNMNSLDLTSLITNKKTNNNRVFRFNKRQLKIEMIKRRFILDDLSVCLIDAFVEKKIEVEENYFDLE